MCQCLNVFKNIYQTVDIPICTHSFMGYRIKANIIKFKYIVILTNNIINIIFGIILIKLITIYTNIYLFEQLFIIIQYLVIEPI